MPDQPTTSEIYALLPLTERTLLKRYKSYPFKIANDREGPCDWYVYKDGEPIAVIVYYKGRKLCMHGIVPASGRSKT